jgi:hypothetical protein
MLPYRIASINKDEPPPNRPSNGEIVHLAEGGDAATGSRPRHAVPQGPGRAGPPPAAHRRHRRPAPVTASRGKEGERGRGERKGGCAARRSRHRLGREGAIEKRRGGRGGR